MGSCASVQKGKHGGLVSKTDRPIVLPPSPIKRTTKPVSDASFDLPTNSFDDFGSKDETFFDSRAWLDSDCEDDFYSVNGDFTPSRGSTPVHHRFSTGTPQINKTPPLEKLSSYMPEPSPTGRKKLIELFQYSVTEKPDHNIGNGKAEIKPTTLEVLPKSAQSTPYISGTNSVPGSEWTANGDAPFEKDTSVKAAQCCFPSMISRRGTSERKKRMMSPGIAVSSKA